MTILGFRVSWILIIAGLVCVAIGVFPQWTDWIDPANGDKVQELRFGVWSSPVHQSIQREYNRVQKKNTERGFSESRHIGWETTSTTNFVSWSSLAILVGLICWMLCTKKRNAKPAAAAGTAEKQVAG